MIWLRTCDVEWTSGIYAVRRGIQGYSAWIDLPDKLKYIGFATSLRDAKFHCEVQRQAGLKALAKDLAT